MSQGRWGWWWEDWFGRHAVLLALGDLIQKDQIQDNLAISLAMAREWVEVACIEMKIYRRRKRLTRSAMFNFIMPWVLELGECPRCYAWHSSSPLGWTLHLFEDQGHFELLPYHSANEINPYFSEHYWAWTLTLDSTYMILRVSHVQDSGSDSLLPLTRLEATDNIRRLN